MLYFIHLDGMVAWILGSAMYSCLYSVPPCTHNMHDYLFCWAMCLTPSSCLLFFLSNLWVPHSGFFYPGLCWVRIYLGAIYTMSSTTNHFRHLIVVYLFSSCLLSSMDKSPTHSKDKDVKRKLFHRPSTDEEVIYTHINPPHFCKYMVHRFNASVPTDCPQCIKKSVLSADTATTLPFTSFLP
jgi:hypothetical protein